MEKQGSHELLRAFVQPRPEVRGVIAGMTRLGRVCEPWLSLFEERQEE